jgi:RNA polymerase sigma-70 factor (ECF subfamily)
MTDADLFQSHRPLLFAIAYRMLGSASEAEDVLQDAYLRYAREPRKEVRSPASYLSTIVTRLCLDRLKSARATREHYPGPWLPEPVLTTGSEADAQLAAERQESIEFAFLILLESLTPQERAVFLLREVFEYEYADIAAILELSVANCRQLFHRARTRIAERKPRFRSSTEQRRQMVERFMAAAQQGEVDDLASLLAQDVIFTADGGGKAPAVSRPVHGRQTVAKLMRGLVRNLMRAARRMGGDLRLDVVDINGEPAIPCWFGGRLETVFIFSASGNQINAIWSMRNTDKLAYIERQLRAGGNGVPL